MIRSVRIESPTNKCKFEQVKALLEIYGRCVSYFQIRMPRVKKLTATLDSRFWEITEQKNSFEWVKFQSGFTFHIPFKKTKVWNNWESCGFALSKSLRLSIQKGKLILEFFFEKEAPGPKTEGSIEGLDLGYVNLVACSNGQVCGKEINGFIKSLDKREKYTYRQMQQRSFYELKKLDLSNIKVLVIEDLKRVRHKTRGMFSREHNRRLSHWLYAKVAKWLEQHCKETGVRLIKVSPWKTSQWCRFCNNWDRRNRKGNGFECVNCGYQDNADINASKNLKLLGLAGVYSFRLLQNQLMGIYVH